MRGKPPAPELIPERAPEAQQPTGGCGISCVFAEDADFSSLAGAEFSSLRDSFDLRRHARELFWRPNADGGSRLAPLDGVRALGFLWVVADHAQEVAILYDASYSSKCVFLEQASDRAQSFTAWSCTLSLAGNSGVTIFFVLSGFLIPWILVNAVEREKELSFSRFITRRFFRVWPALNAYWMLSLPLFLYLVPNGGATGFDVYSTWVAPCAASCWTNLVFVTDFGSCIPGMDGGQEHLWTVSTEFQIYLITPLFVHVFLRSERLGELCVLAVIACTLVFWVVMNLRVYANGDTVGCTWINPETPLYCLGQYACGMLCAMGFISSSRSPRKGAWWALDAVRALFASPSSRERAVLAAAVLVALAFVGWIAVLNPLWMLDKRCAPLRAVPTRRGLTSHFCRGLGGVARGSF